MSVVMDDYMRYIHKRTYARYLDDKGRRETWEETVTRYLDFFKNRGQLDDKTYAELYEAIYNLEVMPSMRALMTAGEALDRDNVAGFNCSYLPIDHPKAFDELVYILMCGTGAGFSVERQYISKLPEVAEQMHPTETVITVADSKIGWAKAYRELISLLYAGQVPSWDMSKLRPKGTRLMTFGGRSSGPEPLDELFRFTVDTFTHAVGRKLNSLECHDICCKIAEIVVVGGVRRSALISLSNLTDDRIRRAKHGQFWLENPQRALSNNSVAYTEKPDFEAFLNEWSALYESRSGERGIFSRPAAQKIAERNGRRDSNVDFGTNPCSEIILRPNQFCNLSECVVRANDNPDTLRRKVRIATILGTLQATLTDFRYLRKKWKDNTEEECLLGVSLTGIMDNKLTNRASKALANCLEELRDEAIKTNKEWAKKLGINQSTAITCVKPSGTVSQLVNSASGIHARYSDYYIRRVRADVSDPLCKVMMDAGVEHELANGNPNVMIFSFPQKSPKGAVLASDLPAIEQLQLWECYQDHWCEHKPSCTVYYQDHEFLAIGDWVYNKFDKVSGISFLPYDGGVYQQAPYEPIDKDKYDEMVKAFPKEIKWDIDESEDNTESSQTLACTGNSCEIL